MDALGLGASALLLGALQSIVFRKTGPLGLTYARSFSRTHAFAGESVELVEVIRNAKILPVPWLRVESRMSPSLMFETKVSKSKTSESNSDKPTRDESNSDKTRTDESGDNAEHEIEGDQYHRSSFYVGAFARITRRHRVRLTRRGFYPVGSVAMTGGDLFGLSQWTNTLETGAVVTVYPALLDENEIDAPSSRWQGDLVVRRWIVSDPFLVSGIRPYHAGDAQRDVHWAATAKIGALQVKTHEFTADPRLLVILNVQAKENQWTDLMDYEQERVEYGIRLAATLIMKTLAAGLEAGFAANAPVFGETAPLVVEPRRAQGQAEAALDALARLTIKRARSFPTFLDDLGRMTGMDILILSCYNSELVRERVAALRAMGNSVALRML
ncbi:hypothetical protein FACS1894184_12130 [Clostridia bacterium]|nr:hypothetical protein FACS1894184_12130 [Clostridia bacterium]